MHSTYGVQRAADDGITRSCLWARQGDPSPLPLVVQCSAHSSPLLRLHLHLHNRPATRGPDQMPVTTRYAPSLSSPDHCCNALSSLAPGRIPYHNADPLAHTAPTKSCTALSLCCPLLEPLDRSQGDKDKPIRTLAHLCLCWSGRLHVCDDRSSSNTTTTTTTTSNQPPHATRNLNRRVTGRLFLARLSRPRHLAHASCRLGIRHPQPSRRPQHSRTYFVASQKQPTALASASSSPVEQFLGFQHDLFSSCTRSAVSSRRTTRYRQRMLRF